jgi:hypothetical protein
MLKLPYIVDKIMIVCENRTGGLNE